MQNRRAETAVRFRSALVCAVAFTLLSSSPVLLAENPPSGGPKTFSSFVGPFIDTYCITCHSSDRKKGEIDLERFEKGTDLIRAPRVWTKIKEVLAERDMPPQNKAQPSEEERAAMVDWIDAELAKFDCSSASPGRVTARRLNRAEYDNTVRDLLGVGFQPSEDFPADDIGYGFDNIGDVLSVSPLLLEKYLDAAEEIVTRAIAAENEAFFRIRVEGEHFTPERFASVYENWAMMITREARAHVTVDFPDDGEYIFRVRAFGQQAGPEPAKMGVLVDQEVFARVVVEATPEAPQVYEVRNQVSAGRHEVAVSFLNNYNNPDHPDPAMRGDRNFGFDWLEVRRADRKKQGERERIFVCYPDSTWEEATCARAILEKFAPRAFRRPLTTTEIDNLVGFVLEALSGGESFEEAIALGLQSLLVSPHFLFRIEEEAEADRPPTIDVLTDYQLASRISYFLWNSMPDKRLFDLAASGKLRDPEVIETEVLRMIRDPRSLALTENFAAQWLQLGALDSVSPDPEKFADFDDELREAMRRETLHYFEAVLRDDRSILDFLSSDYTFLNERLAEHYGIDGVKGSDLERVSLEGRSRGGGLLTQASVLTITSNPTRTSPVKRGKWVLEQVLGTPPPPPPPEVEELSEEPEAIVSGSLRQRLEKHRENPACSGCHAQMDALGFAFENFGPIGAWRDFDGEFLIDPSGELPDGQKFDGPEELKKILRGQTKLFARALSEKFLTYALGRGLEYYDRCAVDEVVEALEANDYKLSALLVAVVKTEPFQKRAGGEAKR